jgi:hypothetical protein
MISLTTELLTPIQVGPYSLRVQMFDQVDMTDASDPDIKLSGRLKLDEQAIHVADTQKGVCLADTILHEVLHAVWAVAGGWSWDVDEERVIYTISTTLLDTLRRNPQFVKFLVNT